MRDWANLAHGGICKRKGTTAGPQCGNKSWIPPLLLSPEPALLGRSSAHTFDVSEMSEQPRRTHTSAAGAPPLLEKYSHKNALPCKTAVYV